jgi:hypothetical protein
MFLAGTGMDTAFGQMFANIESPMAGAFYSGATALEQAIIRGCTQGANLLSKSVVDGAEDTGLLASGANAGMQSGQGGGFMSSILGMLGMGGKTGTSSFNMGGMMTAGLGAYSAYQSGGTGAGLMSGLGSMGMMSGNPYLMAGGFALQLISQFMGKKTSSTQSSWQSQAIENMPLNVISGGAELPENYPLPTSAYFAGRQGRQRGNANITIKIEKVEGTNEEIADTIANKVADIYNRQTSRGLNITYP